MCLILDANKYGRYFNREIDMQPIRDWVEKKRGKIAYSPTKKFRDEWEKGGMREMFAEYSRNGKLKLIKRNDVEKKERELEGKGSLKSNDSHIIALALVGKVTLLVSADKDLGTDFKNHVKGNIYKNKSHAHLLRQRTCPS